MRYLVLTFLFLSLVSCTNKAQLQRTVHQAPDLLVLLDKGGRQASSFSSPYDHPVAISPKRLQLLLSSVKVQPSTGLLNSIISGEKKRRPLFDSETAQAMAIRISQALAEADPSEQINFYHSAPENAHAVSITSGFILVKGKQLHLRINHYESPLRKSFPLTSVGKRIPPSEKGKYAFALSEADHMTHRRFKNLIGLVGSDPHWLVIDYAALSFPSPDPSFPSKDSSLPLSTKTLEEKLRTLKHLRKEDLITEKEYLEKKRSILKMF
ncbi:MAG: SHOCT domain-containing protein [Nitrospira sp.]|nr:SHOCT domain-containing protein [Candidatus Manganitrophaceae bacterium]HIL34325.1 SHOCT domain-containing protein [Candidatus Manganitrophaceae bacterium]